MTNVELSNTDAKLFLEFRKDQNAYEVLKLAGVFDNLQRSQITIDCDDCGIADVKIMKVSFRRRRLSTTHLTQFSSLV